MNENQPSLLSYLILGACLQQWPGESLGYAAERLLYQTRRVPRRYRKMARTLLQRGGWAGINRAVGYRNPNRHRVELDRMFGPEVAERLIIDATAHDRLLAEAAHDHQRQ